METEKKRIRVPSHQQSGMPARPIQETNAGYHPSFPFLMLQKRTDDQNSQCTHPLSKGFCVSRGFSKDTIIRRGTLLSYVVQYLLQHNFHTLQTSQSMSLNSLQFLMLTSFSVPTYLQHHPLSSIMESKPFMPASTKIHDLTDSVRLLKQHYISKLRA